MKFLKIYVFHLRIIAFLITNCIIAQNTKYTKSLPEIQHQPPLCNYYVSNLCYGQQTYFKNVSLSATSYTWTIYKHEGGNTYTAQIYTSNATDIGYQFPSKGNYRVDLNAFNGHLSTASKTLTVDTFTKAKFEFSLCQGRFLNLSQCISNTASFWDFGDGTYSTEESPTHYFALAGTQKVKLKVTGSVVDSTELSFGTVPNTFTGKFSFFTKNDTTFFKAQDTIASGLVDYYWTYGDGNKDLIVGSGGSQTYHVYPKLKDSTFYAFLLVRSTCYSAYGMNVVFIDGPDIVKGTSYFPNPVVNGVFHMLSDNKNNLKSVSVTNCLGQKMEQVFITDGKNGVDVDLSSLPSGVYFVSFDFFTQIVTKKVLKN